MNAEARREWVASFNSEALLADGFEAALIGVAERCGQPVLAVYDAAKCIGILVEQGMPEDEAEEFFNFNTTGRMVRCTHAAFLVARTMKECKLGHPL